MTARFIVGDTRAVTATLPDGSVDFIMSSPPYLALRSYLPADHPSKHLEIGSEATPAEFIDVLLALTAEWRRVLNPRTGSIVIELGDTYAGSGGGGGDYLDGGWREGQAQFAGSAASMRETNAAHWRQKNQGKSRSGWHRSGQAEGEREGQRYRQDGYTTDSGSPGAGPGWPRNKSATLIPESYRWALAYGYNPFTGQPSPAGRWQIRNTITRCSPNPPVGALGKKWRPATTDLVVATPDDDKRYWDDVATRVAPSANTHKRLANGAADRMDVPSRQRDGNWSTLPETDDANPAGAPLLDWWPIVAGGYLGAHYAVYPPELCEPFIEAMCPRRVCLTCGEPSRRETTAEYVPSEHYTGNGRRKPHHAGDPINKASMGIDASVVRSDTTTGWTTCGHPGTDGHRLDGYHTGTGWRPGIVLDPFAGTFTTGAVATGHGRNAIGIDLDSRNAELALGRVGPLLLTVEHHELVA